MAISFTRALPPARDAQIAAVEKRLGSPLPETYAAFLRRHNGGCLDDNYFGDGHVSVRYLYSAGATDDEHVDSLEWALDFYSPQGEADAHPPAGFLPVGEDEGGNLICLDIAGEETGTVYFWQHDVVPDEEALLRVAADFSEFFEGLRPLAEL